jgi:hypothetical protein
MPAGQAAQRLLRADEALRRHETLLTRWEQLITRIERVLDRIEEKQQPSSQVEKQDRPPRGERAAGDGSSASDPCDISRGTST